MPRTRSSISIPYTAAPIHLILSDLALWFRITFVLPPAGLSSIIFPIGPFNSGPLDELYPSIANLWALAVHLTFLFVQSGFLLTLVPAALGIAPPWISGYTPAWLIYVVGFVLVTRSVTTVVLNGRGKTEYLGDLGVTDEDRKKFKAEKWIFVNGVAAGQHWMQSNVDRLALTFKREVLGIHNETRGILFDLVECILERTLGWATPSTRRVYAKLLEIISDDTYERIVLILHSQGAIEGGLALDWLFATVPASLLGKLEVYTFGSATNHFNNPSFQVLDDAGNPMQMEPDQDGRILKHVEHYANEGDYVAQFGILNFRSRPGKVKGLFDGTAEQERQNMYYGRLFLRKGFGHQFNNNYLDTLFTLDDTRTRVKENNAFMNATFDEPLLLSSDIVATKERQNQSDNSISPHAQTRGQTVRQNRRVSMSTPRIKGVSRLWNYRNGGIPDDDGDSHVPGGNQGQTQTQSRDRDRDPNGEIGEDGESFPGDEQDIRRRRLAKGYESDLDDCEDGDGDGEYVSGRQGLVSPLKKLG